MFCRQILEKKTQQCKWLCSIHSILIMPPSSHYTWKDSINILTLSLIYLANSYIFKEVIGQIVSSYYMLRLFIHKRTHQLFWQHFLLPEEGPLWKWMCMPYLETLTDVGNEHIVNTFFIHYYSIIFLNTLFLSNVPKFLSLLMFYKRPNTQGNHFPGE